MLASNPINLNRQAKIMCNLTAAVLGCDLIVTKLRQLSEDEKFVKDNVNLWVDGVIGTTIAVVGLFINSLTIFILRTKQDLKHVSTGLLCSLLVADNLFLAIKIINNCYWDFGVTSLGKLVTLALYPTEKIFLTMTIFLTVSIAHQGSAMATDFERYDRISSDQTSRRMKILLYILPVVVSAVIFNIPRFLCYEFIEGRVEKTELRKNFHFIVVYENFVANILTVFGPITMLVFYNWNIYLFINEKHREIEEWNMDTKIRKQNKNHANVLFIIIIMFIICHFPRCFLKFYKGFYEPLWIKILLSLSRTLIILHKSTTAIIYIIKNHKVQTYLRDIFGHVSNRTKSCSTEMQTKD